MVKAIIFDFWGTLVENGVFPSPVRQVKYILRIEEHFSDYIVKFEEVFMLKKYDDLYSAFKAVCEAFNKKPEQFILDRLVGMWNKHKLLAKPFNETIGLLENLKKEGYKIALISNTDCFTTDDVLDKYDLRKYFDHAVFSYDVKMLKTNPKMFENILKELDVDKSEALVVGDSIETDMNGAKAAGIKSILVDRRGRRDFNPKIKDLSELENYMGSN
ncbi:MAG: HAD family hydrolase [Nanoarchaeota archaeon]|nr:HAD family hydrolase [Nanoarchaeota archaeon]MCG2718945.1 HAD family hydrolase [Nanoarchaeota archaeon]